MNDLLAKTPRSRLCQTIVYLDIRLWGRYIFYAFFAHQKAIYSLSNNLIFLCSHKEILKRKCSQWSFTWNLLRNLSGTSLPSEIPSDSSFGFPFDQITSNFRSVFRWVWLTQDPLCFLAWSEVREFLSKAKDVWRAFMAKEFFCIVWTNATDWLTKHSWGSSFVHFLEKQEMDIAIARSKEVLNIFPRWFSV